jgi:hypothetical protein
MESILTGGPGAGIENRDAAIEFRNGICIVRPRVVQLDRVLHFGGGVPSKGE